MKRFQLLIFEIVFVCLPFFEANGQWVQTNSLADPYALVASGTNVVVGSFSRGVLSTSNNGTSWIDANDGLAPTRIYALSASPDGVGGTNLFAGTDGGGVFLSTNNGSSWVNCGLTNYNVIVLAANGSYVLAVAARQYGSVFISTNSGASWTEANNGLTNVNVKSFAISSNGKGGTNLFGGTQEGGVFLSTNDGTSWINIGLANTPVYAFAFSGTNLFAGGGGGVYRSTNNGSSWVNCGLSSSTVWSFAVSGSKLFAGTWDGLFLSTNNGSDWVSVGLTNTPINRIAVCGANLFAAIWNSGVWKRPLSEMTTAIESEQSMPMRFALGQNYPNPFNPSTIIRYELPKAANVTLKIFNTLGQEVTTLVNEQKDAGYYQSAWNTNVPSGIYFYRLQAAEYVETKKMILLK